MNIEERKQLLEAMVGLGYREAENAPQTIKDFFLPLPAHRLALRPEIVIVRGAPLPAPRPPIVALAAVGALLVSVVLVVPAATVRLVARDLRQLQLGTGALAAAEGLAALWLAEATNVSPGPAMAIV
ncbi:MAG TPA: metal ABC transporter permease, partial [Sorangium sp.]|nr:metal ABC transporter permease [Sorangium sp.]